MNNLIINITKHFSKKIYIPNFFWFYRWINIIIKNFINNKNIIVNISLVNYQQIIQLNTKFANHNYVTDVLSFPYSYVYKKHSMLLGEIIICSEVIITIANKKSKPIINQYAQVIIHSILHLLNFDHNNKHKANIMFKLEKKMLTQLGY